MPAQKIRVACGSVDVRDERIEPDCAGSYVRRGAIACGRIKHYGAGQIVERQIQANARLEQVPYFFVGLVSSKGGIHLDQDQFGHLDPEFTSDLTCNQFGDQCQRPLPRTAKLEDVETEIISLY